MTIKPKLEIPHEASVILEELSLHEEAIVMNFVYEVYEMGRKDAFKETLDAIMKHKIKP